MRIAILVLWIKRRSNQLTVWAKPMRWADCSYWSPVVISWENAGGIIKYLENVDAFSAEDLSAATRFASFKKLYATSENTLNSLSSATDGWPPGSAWKMPEKNRPRSKLASSNLRSSACSFWWDVVIYCELRRLCWTWDVLCNFFSLQVVLPSRVWHWEFHPPPSIRSRSWWMEPVALSRGWYCSGVAPIPHHSMQYLLSSKHPVFWQWVVEVQTILHDPASTPRQFQQLDLCDTFSTSSHLHTEDWPVGNTSIIWMHRFCGSSVKLSSNWSYLFISSQFDWSLQRSSVALSIGWENRTKVLSL